MQPSKPNRYLMQGHELVLDRNPETNHDRSVFSTSYPKPRFLHLDHNLPSRLLLLNAEPRPTLDVRNKSSQFMDNRGCPVQSSVLVGTKIPKMLVLSGHRPVHFLVRQESKLPCSPRNPKPYASSFADMLRETLQTVYGRVPSTARGTR